MAAARIADTADGGSGGLLARGLNPVGTPTGSERWRWLVLLPAAMLGMAGYGTVIYGQSAFILPVQAQVPSLSTAAMPYALSARSCTFGVANVLGGSLLFAGTPRRRVGLALFLLLAAYAGIAASIQACGAAPDAPSTAALTGLFASFVLLGFACASYYLPVYHSILGWFPDRRRGRVVGCLGVGQACGGILWNSVGPILALRLPASSLFLVCGATVALLWSCTTVIAKPAPADSARMVEPADAPRSGGASFSVKGSAPSFSLEGPAPGRRAARAACCNGGWGARWRRRAADSALPLMLLVWLSVSMTFGFGVHAVLLYYLQGAMGFSPEGAGLTSAALGGSFLLARLAVGFSYDWLGARRFALALHGSNLVLHACFVLQQRLSGHLFVLAPAVPRGEPLSREAAPLVWPLLVLLLCCNAGAVTCWGPLTLDLLGASEGRRWMGVMVSSISIAQAVGSAAVGLAISRRGIADAMLVFGTGSTAGLTLSTACLVPLLRAHVGEHTAALEGCEMGPGGERAGEEQLARALGAASSSSSAPDEAGAAATQQPHVPVSQQPHVHVCSASLGWSPALEV